MPSMPLCNVMSMKIWRKGNSLRSLRTRPPIEKEYEEAELYSDEFKDEKGEEY